MFKFEVGKLYRVVFDEEDSVIRSMLRTTLMWSKDGVNMGDVDLREPFLYLGQRSVEGNASVFCLVICEDKIGLVLEGRICSFKGIRELKSDD